jgi:hypothetical protein
LLKAEIPMMGLHLRLANLSYSTELLFGNYSIPHEHFYLQEESGHYFTRIGLSVPNLDIGEIARMVHLHICFTIAPGKPTLRDQIRFIGKQVLMQSWVGEKEVTWIDEDLFRGIDMTDRSRSLSLADLIQGRPNGL